MGGRLIREWGRIRGTLRYMQAHTNVHDIVRVRIVGQPVIEQSKLSIIKDNRVGLTERKEPANQSPARSDVRCKNLIGWMNDTADKTNQLWNLVKTLRSREILYSNGERGERGDLASLLYMYQNIA